MRSFLVRCLAAAALIPVVPLLLLARTCVATPPPDTPAPPPRARSWRPDGPAENAGELPPGDSEPSPPGDLSSRDDAVVELAELRAEIDAIDAQSGRAFSRTLREVLDDPERSVAARDGSYRLPAREGIDALLAYFPKPADAQADEANWALLDVAALLESSASGTETDNYLALDATRHVRGLLFQP